MPIIEDRLGPDAAQLREALSQLQMAYAQLTGQGGGGEGGPGGGEQPAQEQPAQGPRPSGLWVPGQ